MMSKSWVQVEVFAAPLPRVGSLSLSLREKQTNKKTLITNQSIL